MANLLQPRCRCNLLLIKNKGLLSPISGKVELKELGSCIRVIHGINPTLAILRTVSAFPIACVVVVSVHGLCYFRAALERMSVGVDFAIPY